MFSGSRCYGFLPRVILLFLALVFFASESGLANGFSRLSALVMNACRAVMTTRRAPRVTGLSFESLQAQLAQPNIEIDFTSVDSLRAGFRLSTPEGSVALGTALVNLSGRTLIVRARDERGSIVTERVRLGRRLGVGSDGVVYCVADACEEVIKLPISEAGLDSLHAEIDYYPRVRAAGLPIVDILSSLEHSTYIRKRFVAGESFRSVASAPKRTLTREMIEGLVDIFIRSLRHGIVINGHDRDNLYWTERGWVFIELPFRNFPVVSAVERSWISLFLSGRHSALAAFRLQLERRQNPGLFAGAFEELGPPLQMDRSEMMEKVVDVFAQLQTKPPSLPDPLPVFRLPGANHFWDPMNQDSGSWDHGAMVSYLTPYVTAIWDRDLSNARLTLSVPVVDGSNRLMRLRVEINRSLVPPRSAREIGEILGWRVVGLEGL